MIIYFNIIYINEINIKIKIKKKRETRPREAKESISKISIVGLEGVSPYKRTVLSFIAALTFSVKSFFLY